MKNEKDLSRRNFFQKFSIGFGMGMVGLHKNIQRKDISMPLISGLSEKNITARLLENARLVLEVSCRAKSGETLLIIADETLLPYSPALASAAVELGLIPAIMDITDYLSSKPYQDGFVLEPLKAAMESADIVIENLADTWVSDRPDFGRLVGDPDYQDKSLTAKRRWVIIQCNGMEKWEVDPEEIAAIPKRTHWLKALLGSAEKGHIISPAGTDFTFGLGADSMHTPVLGIVPFYGEVAVTPSLESTSGTFIVDGPTQQNVRPADELDREPLRITVEAGRVKNMSGDPVQLKRLKEFIASGDPPADAIDEVGILTTTLKENDIYYWSDGTHHHDRAHIALGNNVRRDTVVHGPKHMDGEICKPTISIDGLIIVKNGIFQDSVMQNTGR